MKRFISALILVATLATPALAYSDVPADSWYAAGARSATLQGYMSGTGNNKFSPDGIVTWAQVAQVLYHGPQRTISMNTPWYYDAVQAMPYTIENPDAVISRAETMACFYAYSGSPAADLSLLKTYTDINQDNAAVAWAIQAGLITGTSDTTISPDGTLTRAQLAVMIDRYSPMKKTVGQATEPNANGYYTHANVDIEGARLRYEALDALNKLLAENGKEPARWVETDEMEEYTLCRAKELWSFGYTHDRPLSESYTNGFGNSECILLGADSGPAAITGAGAIAGWATSGPHRGGMLGIAPGNQVCIASYKGAYVLTMFATDDIVSYAADNYYYVP